MQCFPLLEGIWWRQWGNSRRSHVLRLRKLDSIPAAVSHCLPHKTGQILSLSTTGHLGEVSHFLGAQSSLSVAELKEMLNSHSCNRSRLELWFEFESVVAMPDTQKEHPRVKHPNKLTSDIWD